MPRSKRVEFAGAIYHVINRGNYRQDLFSLNDWKTAKIFEKTLRESCAKFAWSVHAYVIMSNHYHLCIETPFPNLSAGMQWLQSVFANRFNHFSQTPGHVFQGRYKALVVEKGKNFLPLINYIHLNPVRVGLLEVADLANYQWSSFPAFLKKQNLPDFLHNESWLKMEGFSSGVAGMKQYWKYLEFREEGSRKIEQELNMTFCHGWCIGSKAYRKTVLSDIQVERFLEKGGKCQQSMLDDLWREELERCLKLLKKGKVEIEADAKNAKWKRVIGYRLKNHFGVSNRYLSEHLNMGTISYVSTQVKSLENEKIKENEDWKIITTNKKA